MIKDIQYDFEFTMNIAECEVINILYITYEDNTKETIKYKKWLDSSVNENIWDDIEAFLTLEHLANT